MYRDNIIEALRKKIDINIPIIYINDYDTIRINSIIKDAVSNDRKIKEWNPGTRLTNFWSLTSFKQEESKKDISKDESKKKKKKRIDDLIYHLYNVLQKEIVHPAVFILREVQDYLNEAPVKSLLASIAQRRLYDSKFELTILIVSSVNYVPEELLPYVSFIDIGFPDDDEIRQIVYRHLYINDFGYEKTEEAFRDKTELEINDLIIEYIEYEKNKGIREQVDFLLPNFRGMTPFDIDRMVDMAMSLNGTLGEDDYNLILDHKKQLVKKSGVLELVEINVGFDQIGGLKRLKKYLRRKAIIRRYSKEASEKGITLPKGVFLVGMPGCGKSLTAQAAASLFKEPLLKLDMGTLMGSKVGESEKNLRKAIRIAEAAAPCVLWVDEIEKGFSGSNNDDNAYLRRMFGYFLTWLQDKKSEVYVIATANNLQELPVEFKRKGRFDDMFFIDLPDEEECKAIIDIKIRRVDKKWDNNTIEINKSNLIKYVSGQKIDNDKEKNPESHHFCGADLEYIVNQAFEMIFRKNKLLQMDKEHALKQSIESIINKDHNNTDEYFEDSIKVPDEIDEHFLLEIAQKTKCIGRSYEDESFSKMREASPSNHKDASPYLPAS